MKIQLCLGVASVVCAAFAEPSLDFQRASGASNWLLSFLLRHGLLQRPGSSGGQGAKDRGFSNGQGLSNGQKSFDALGQPNGQGPSIVQSSPDGQDSSDEEDGSDDEQSLTKPSGVQKPSNGKGLPKFNLQDKRFLNHRPAQSNESRSSCPAMNSLANHNFIPHSGMNMTLSDVVTGCFEGFGASPEICGLVCIAGMINAKLRLSDSFNLADISRPEWKIEHDSSLSRKDSSQESNVSKFDFDAWNVSLKVFGKAEVISAVQLGKAKSARIRDAKKKNAKSVYDSRTASRSVTEIALLTSVLGNIDGWAKTDFVRSLFERERLPWNLGWRPRLHDADLPSVLGIAALTLTADPEILSMTSDGAVLTPDDIVKATSARDKNTIPELRALARKLGLSTPAFEALLDRLAG